MSNLRVRHLQGVDRKEGRKKGRKEGRKKKERETEADVIQS